MPGPILNGIPRISFLGPLGTFCEAALRQVAPKDCELIPCSGVPAALEALRTGVSDRAVVPIENSVEGGVNATLDSLAHGDPLTIVAEMVVPITFCLVTRADSDIELGQIQRIATHPHAWAQCHKWVLANIGDVTHLPATSTAGAAKALKEDVACGYDAALCSKESADLYGLRILAQGVADNPDAVTRFVLVSKPGSTPLPTGADKTTLQVTLPNNRAGALLTMLEQFSARGVNLSRIESRPAAAYFGNYSFSIDLEGHVADERVQSALIGLHRTSPEVRFLGSYPKANGVPTRVDDETTDSAFRDARAWVGAVVAGYAT
ncbi:MAG: prephenate dehydratase [Actinomycetaceae bacterium]|nr:prephenate dehydratase [Actinomycetaceae bacterium]